MARILIASTSATFCRVLKDLIPETHEALICAEVPEIFEALQSLRPDLLVLDIQLAGMDGLYLLENARNAGLDFKLLLLGATPSPYLRQRLEQLEITHYMTKPCDSLQVAVRAISICMEEQPQYLAPSLTEAELILMNLGFHPHVSGYRELIWAVYSYWKNPYQSLTKELYPFVAEQCGGDWKKAERAMRSSIDKAYNRRNESLWRLYFNKGRDGKVPHMSIATFLGSLCTHLRRASLQQERKRKID